MTGVARIRFAGGGLMLPARSAYDREMVLAALRHSLHRSGTVQFDLDGRSWVLTCPAPAEPADCARCLRTGRLYGFDDRRVGGPVCATCLAAVLSVTPAASRAAPAAPAEDDPLPGAAAGGAPSAARTRSAPQARREEIHPWQPSS